MLDRILHKETPPGGALTVQCKRSDQEREETKNKDESKVKKKKKRLKQPSVRKQAEREGQQEK